MANDKKVEPKPGKGAAGKPEVLNPGTSAEEQKKGTPASKLYPKKLGLRGAEMKD